ncbi:MAG TPA: hypothetical protein VGM90_35340 [Kofleriaceae bacterium]|jgi:hypothetical protein
MSELPKAIERGITLREGETVVAYRHRSDQDWALITTQRLRWFLDGSLTDLNVARIIERKVIRAKNQPPVMRLISTDGEQYEMPLDEGASYAAFWDAVTAALPANGK